MTQLTEETLTPAIVAHLATLGWTFDEERGRWWKTYPDGSVWSSNPADHDREFPADLAAATLATAPVYSLEENLDREQGGHTTEELLNTSGDNLRSVQVAAADDIERVRQSHQFEADAATKGFTDANPQATASDIEQIRQSHQFEADKKTQGFIDSLHQ